MCVRRAGQIEATRRATTPLGGRQALGDGVQEHAVAHGVVERVYAHTRALPCADVAGPMR